MSAPALLVRNAERFQPGGVAAADPVGFRRLALERLRDGWRLVTLFGEPLGGGRSGLWAVLADDASARLAVMRTEVGERYPAFSDACVAASRFEREIAEQLGIVPEGHPWLKPLRSPAAAPPGSHRLHDATLPIGADYPFFHMDGLEVHEVAVGPVHAGVIEPGHFRFQCHGETVYHLEIMLGFQHRGLEALLVGGPDRVTVFRMEDLAGDTTIGHALAYVQAVEALAGCAVPARAHALRALALELERLANHTGDLGALAGDVAFQPTAASCGRLRGAFLNMTASLCGSRFGRCFLRPGGVSVDPATEQIRLLATALAEAERELTAAAGMLLSNAGVQDRMEGTGIVAETQARALGMVGPAARASGLARDVRHDHPFGMYRLAHVPPVTTAEGDVFARASIRWLEAQRSLSFARALLEELPAGAVRVECGALDAGAGVVSLVEAWRGEAAHVALSGSSGRFRRYKVTDPSFHNWPALELALRGQAISDFPLCNKSFNLSYGGHDL